MDSQNSNSDDEHTLNASNIIQDSEIQNSNVTMVAGDVNITTIINNPERETSTSTSPVPDNEQPADAIEVLIDGVNVVKDGVNVVKNGVNVVKDGVSDTASSMTKVVQQKSERKGLVGMFGGVLKKIPGTLAKPVVFAAEATSNVVGGMKNQFSSEAEKKIGSAR